MSIMAMEMPFQQAEESSRKKGSTISSLEAAPSPTAPTRRSAGSTRSTCTGPDWLPRRPRPSQLVGSASTSSPSTRKQERSA